MGDVSGRALETLRIRKRRVYAIGTTAGKSRDWLS